MTEWTARTSSSSSSPSAEATAAAETATSTSGHPSLSSCEKVIARGGRVGKDAVGTMSGGAFRRYESLEVSTARLGFSKRKYDFPIVTGGLVGLSGGLCVFLVSFSFSLVFYFFYF